MPYKSEAQRKFFNANRDKLEAEGVDVDEWNKSTKGKKLPKKVKKKAMEEFGRKLAALNLRGRLEHLLPEGLAPRLAQGIEKVAPPFFTGAAGAGAGAAAVGIPAMQRAAQMREQADQLTKQLATSQKALEAARAPMTLPTGLQQLVDRFGGAEKVGQNLMLGGAGVGAGALAALAIQRMMKRNKPATEKVA